MKKVFLFSEKKNENPIEALSSRLKREPADGICIAVALPSSGELSGLCHSLSLSLFDSIWLIDLLAVAMNWIDLYCALLICMLFSDCDRLSKAQPLLSHG